MSVLESTLSSDVLWYRDYRGLAVVPSCWREETVPYFAIDGTGTASESEAKHFDRFKELWKRSLDAPFREALDDILTDDILQGMWSEVVRVSAVESLGRQMRLTVWSWHNPTFVSWKGGESTAAESLGLNLQGSSQGGYGSDVYLFFDLVDIPVRSVRVPETWILHYPAGFFKQDSPAENEEVNKGSSNSMTTIDWEKLPVQIQTRLNERSD